MEEQKLVKTVRKCVTYGEANCIKIADKDIDKVLQLLKDNNITHDFYKSVLEGFCSNEAEYQIERTFESDPIKANQVIAECQDELTYKIYNNEMTVDNEAIGIIADDYMRNENIREDFKIK